MDKDKLVDRIRQAKRAKGNKTCADCGEKGPTYVCSNFATFLCNSCSGIHREFSHRVKSISMSIFTEAEVVAIENGGNVASNDKWRARLKSRDYRHPAPGETDKIREFIRMTYVDRRWYREKKKKKTKKTKTTKKTRKKPKPEPEPEPEPDYEESDEDEITFDEDISEKDTPPTRRRGRSNSKQKRHQQPPKLAEPPSHQHQNHHSSRSSTTTSSSSPNNNSRGSGSINAQDDSSDIPDLLDLLTLDTTPTHHAPKQATLDEDLLFGPPSTSTTATSTSTAPPEPSQTTSASPLQSSSIPPQMPPPQSATPFYYPPPQNYYAPPQNYYAPPPQGAGAYGWGPPQGTPQGPPQGHPRAQGQSHPPGPQHAPPSATTTEAGLAGQKAEVRPETATNGQQQQQQESGKVEEDPFGDLLQFGSSSSHVPPQSSTHGVQPLVQSGGAGMPLAQSGGAGMGGSVPQNQNPFTGSVISPQKPELKQGDERRRSSDGVGGRAPANMAPYGGYPPPYGYPPQQFAPPYGGGYGGYPPQQFAPPYGRGYGGYPPPQYPPQGYPPAQNGAAPHRGSG